MAWDNWVGSMMTNDEELLKRGFLLSRAVIFETNRARLALNVSAARFLAYCAFARFARRNRHSLSMRSFLIVLRAPRHWELSDLVAMAKLILKKNPEVWVGQHTEKNKKGHEFDAAEALKVSRLILFAHDDIELHPDVVIAASVIERVEVGMPRHFAALSRLMHCGPLLDTELSALGTVPMEKFDAIFRMHRSAAAAIRRIPPDPKENAEKSRPLIDPTRGFGEASIWARNLRDDLNAWRAGRLDWAELDTGILLFGPPGTGKTMFATALAASLGVHLVATSVMRWQSAKDGHLGDLLRAMYTTFSEATNNAPCLVFLDELDSIGHRDRFPSKWENYSIQVVNALLENVDGAQRREGVIVVGASNSPDKIDPALLRSGRLEKHVHFPLPGPEDRREIFESYLPHLIGDQKLAKVADRMAGKTGSDINKIVREARRLARKGARDVSASDIELLVPPERPLSEEELFLVAVHECGHALIASMLEIGDVQNVEVYDNKTTFAKDTKSHGLTAMEHPASFLKQRSKLLAYIAMLLAGMAAEEVILGDRSNSAGGGPNSDLDRATLLSMEFVAVYGLSDTLCVSFDVIDRLGFHELWKDRTLRDDANRVLQAEYERVKQLLNSRRPTLLAMSMVLTEKKALSGAELDYFLRDIGSNSQPARTG
ncbi:AAA family ATPase [Rhizobium ruizarguesonis]|nr:AAA family ATPase [Rhizobium ruizarguesonis]